MNLNEKRDQSRIKLIRRMHGFVEKPDIEKHRQSQNAIGVILGNSKDVTYKEININGLHGEWACVNRVHQKKQVILYCHGGGFSTGSCIYGRTLTGKLASTTSIDVLSFDYGLAPENPYPKATLDALKAWDYLMLLGYGAENVILAGDSAGGNLALVLALTLKKDGRFLPGGLVLLSPFTDLTKSGKSYQEKAEVDPVLDEAYIDRMIKAYIPKMEQDISALKDPMVSPLFGDFSGFPKTLIQVGENEILLSDAVMLHKKMQHDKVTVTIKQYKGMWHVFQMSPFKTAYEAMDQIAEFIFSL